MPSTRRPSPRAARTTARRAPARSTTRRTTARTCSTPTATTSRPSATPPSRALVARRRLELVLGRFAAPQLAAPLGLGVHLRAEQEREAADPEPREQDDHRGERPPGLVVRAELADVKREAARGKQPDGHADHRSDREERPAWMIDVRAEVEDRREGEQEPEDQHQEDHRQGDQPPLDEAARLFAVVG